MHIYLQILASLLQRLVFVLRDWGYPYEYPYGKDGGEAYVNKILKVRFKFIRNQKYRISVSNKNVIEMIKLLVLVFHLYFTYER